MLYYKHMFTSNKKNYLVFAIIAIAFLAAGIIFYKQKPENKIESEQPDGMVESLLVNSDEPVLDAVAYEKKLWQIANNSTSTASSTTFLWPAKAVRPKAGAILPFSRVVAYYGNLYSKGMGILGEYSEDEVLRRLQIEVGNWSKADPSTPVVPALHYIAVVAQASPTRDGKYRARMPEKEIQKVLKMAEKVGGIVFLDIQAGLSSIETELPFLEKYLKLPNVHLGLDPEFYMKVGGRPGERIGTMDAEEINFAIGFLSGVVKENNLPPKILIVHRFTRPMLTNSEKITPTPEVQVVINMDGFGAGGNKIATYKNFVAKEPVQFTGFKIFYKNDSAKGNRLLLPHDLLKLAPIPVYVQYQ